MAQWFPHLGVKCRCHQSVILLGGLAQGGPTFCPSAPFLCLQLLGCLSQQACFSRMAWAKPQSPAHTCPQAKLKPSEGGFEQSVPSLGISLSHSLLPIMSGAHIHTHLHTFIHIFIYTLTIYTQAHTHHHHNTQPTSSAHIHLSPVSTFCHPNQQIALWWASGLPLSCTVMHYDCANLRMTPRLADRHQEEEIDTAAKPQPKVSRAAPPLSHPDIPENGWGWHDASSGKIMPLVDTGDGAGQLRAGVKLDCSPLHLFPLPSC